MTAPASGRQAAATPLAAKDRVSRPSVMGLALAQRRLDHQPFRLR